jgi:hypothetical protein
MISKQMPPCNINLPLILIKHFMRREKMKRQKDNYQNSFRVTLSFCIIIPIIEKNQLPCMV